MKGEITLTFKENGLKIKIRDSASRVRFLEAQLPIKSTMLALGNFEDVKCEFETKDLDKIGKKLKLGTFTFEYPNVEEKKPEEEENEIKEKIIEEYLDEDDNDPQSINTWIISFFVKDEKRYCRASIKRWV